MKIIIDIIKSPILVYELALSILFYVGTRISDKKIKNISTSYLAHIVIMFTYGMLLSLLLIKFLPLSIHYDTRSIYYILVGYLASYLLNSSTVTFPNIELHFLKNSLLQPHRIHKKMFWNSFSGILVNSAIIGINIFILKSINLFYFKLLVFIFSIYLIFEGISLRLLLNMVANKLSKESLILTATVSILIGYVIADLYLTNLPHYSYGYFLCFFTGYWIFPISTKLVLEMYIPNKFFTLTYFFIGLIAITLL